MMDECNYLLTTEMERLLAVAKGGWNAVCDRCLLLLMLRHACGYALADQSADTWLIQDYLSHRNIQHTARYTAANSIHFKRL